MGGGGGEFFIVPFKDKVSIVFWGILFAIKTVTASLGWGKKT